MSHNGLQGCVEHLQATSFVLLQVIYTRNPDRGQLLCTSGQLPGARAVTTVQELLLACKASLAHGVISCHLNIFPFDHNHVFHLTRVQRYTIGLEQF